MKIQRVNLVELFVRNDQLAGAASSEAVLAAREENDLGYECKDCGHVGNSRVSNPLRGLDARATGRAAD
jgi:hypothetical protein